MSAPPQSHRGPTSDHATWLLLERLRGIGPVFKGEPILLPAALDQVPRLDVFRERQYRVAVRTAHPIRESCQPLPSFLSDAQGVARAVRTIEQVARRDFRRQLDLFTAVGASDRHRRLEPQEALEPPPVEADDHLVVDRDDGYGHTAGLGDQFLPSRRVLRDVLCHKGNSLRRKKLFRRVAGLSRGRPIDRDRAVRHGVRLLRSPPKTRSPSLKASDTGVPAPSIVGLASHHALMCSSDRKKLRVVQVEVKARRSSAHRFPAHIMIPSALGPGPDGSTENSSDSPQWWQRDRMRTDSPSIGATPNASIAQQTWRSPRPDR